MNSGPQQDRSGGRGERRPISESDMRPRPCILEPFATIHNAASGREAPRQVGQPQSTPALAMENTIHAGHLCEFLVNNRSPNVNPVFRSKIRSRTPASVFPRQCHPEMGGGKWSSHPRTAEIAMFSKNFPGCGRPQSIDNAFPAPKLLSGKMGRAGRHSSFLPERRKNKGLFSLNTTL